MTGNDLSCELKTQAWSVVYEYRDSYTSEREIQARKGGFGHGIHGLRLLLFVSKSISQTLQCVLNLYTGVSSRPQYRTKPHEVESSVSKAQLEQRHSEKPRCRIAP